MGDWYQPEIRRPQTWWVKPLRWLGTDWFDARMRMDWPAPNPAFGGDGYRYACGCREGAPCSIAHHSGFPGWGNEELTLCAACAEVIGD